MNVKDFLKEESEEKEFIGKRYLIKNHNQVIFSFKSYYISV